MSYKMIAMDLDGTLISSNKCITPKTKEALIRFQKEGGKVVLASGPSDLRYEDFGRRAGIKTIRRLSDVF